jgi:hypothetical protein
MSMGAVSQPAGRVHSALWAYQRLVCDACGVCHTCVARWFDSGVCCMQGGAKNFSIAHKYYCRVLELSQGDNVRALFGVQATKSALDASGKAEASSELHSLSRGRLLQMYSKKAPEKVELVASVLSD